MDYLCAHYWQQDESKISLVLKQLTYHKDNLPVIFGAIAEGTGREQFVAAMTEWFYEEGVYGCARGTAHIAVLHKKLEAALRRASRSLEAGALLFCIGNQFFLWKQGEIKICLINSRFGRYHCQVLLSEQEYGTEQCINGSMENGVGLLLATDNFYRGISAENLERCLLIKELNQEIRVEKRLHELGRELERKGEKHLGAMLVVTC